MGNFFLFSSKLSSSTFQARILGLRQDRDVNGLFDENRLIQGIYNGISFPVSFKQKSGKRLEDILDTGWAGLFLISERLKSILKENNLSGWKVFPIALYDMQDKKINGYHGLSITGRSGPLDFAKSRIIEKRLVPQGPQTRYYKGVEFDLNKYDGSDFFLPEKYFGTVVTETTENILNTNKVTNVSLRNLTDVEFDNFTVQAILGK